MSKKSFKRVIGITLTIILLLGNFPLASLGTTAAQTASLVTNHSFENDLVGWQTNGSNAITTPTSGWLPANGGSKLLNYWNAGAYTADTNQTITGLENGSYTLSAWVANSGGFNEKSIYAKKSGVEIAKKEIPTASSWTKVELPIVVDSGQLTIGFYANALGGGWLGVDLVSLVKDADLPQTPSKPKDFIYGVDISTLTKVENYGGKFYDQGEEKDVLEILTSYGSNWARLKIWEDPTDVYSDGIAYNDLEDTIVKAVRIKEADMKYLLNFHYSGFWADPGRQDKPASWVDLSFADLVQAVYDHTADTIEALIEAGAAPDMVQIGNEIRPGMLFPDGRIVNNNYNNLANLLNSGIKAVRDTLGEEVDIMIHLDQGGENGIYRRWFDGIIAAGVTDFQIIGASYYPYWHGTLAQLEYNLNDISQRYDKDVVVVETAYAFTLADADGHGNIFTRIQEERAGYPATVEGQARLVYDVMEVVRNVPNQRGLGVFYWEPAWLGVKGAGWTAGEGNGWENQAMFDFEGNALESLKVFTEGYVPPVPEPREIEDEEIDEILAGLILHSGNKPAVASGSAGLGGGIPNAPENAVDGEQGTSWGTNTGVGAWWQVDLEKSVSLERILFTTWDAVRVVEIEIAENGEQFSKLGMYEVSEGKIDVTLPEGTSARHIRVTITESSGEWVGFNNFQAYGPPPQNLVINPSFEDSDRSMWKIIHGSGTTPHASFQNKAVDARTGNYTVHFWSASAVDFKVEQTITGLAPGYYNFSMYLQGGDAGNNPEMYIYANTTEKEYRKDTGVKGWTNWNNPEVTEILVLDGTVTIGAHIKAGAGAWGTLDDFYFYLLEPVHQEPGDGDQEPGDGEKEKQLEKGKQEEVKADTVILIEDSRSSLKLPANLPIGSKLTILEVDESKKVKQSSKVAGDVLKFDFEYPNGEEFTGNFTLVLAYDDENFAANEVGIYYFDEISQEWIFKGGLAEDGVITLEVPHFSTYGVFSTNNVDQTPVPGDGDETAVPGDGDETAVPGDGDETAVPG
ncbi:MAG: glycosyl hydrolase 53 family protein, partial [Anaerobacillus sp.]|uniref:glycosyl hydrolase 53 family protein n=1 Tax=Anaerobacillus sp. TaxID=1872506 RepID=UPI00391888DF